MMSCGLDSNGPYMWNNVQKYYLRGNIQVKLAGLLIELVKIKMLYTFTFRIDLLQLSCCQTKYTEYLKS